VTYEAVFIDRKYSIEDLDRLWQFVNYKITMDAWNAVESEAK
jgi:hypothetical protein